MKNELFILWTNDNVITSEKMVLMYGHASIKNKWWDEVTIIIWGPTAKLVAENTSIQDKLKEMMNDNIHISACRACADQLGVTDILEDLDIEVIYWGEPLTDIIKNNQKLITI